MDMELGRLRREASGTLEQLAEYSGVSVDQLQDWERTSSVPRKQAARVKWAIWALQRDAALAKSGLPECTSAMDLERDFSEQNLEALTDHFEQCELCKRREKYVKEAVGPMPPMQRGLFMHVVMFVGQLEGWRQRAAAGGLIVLAMGGTGVLWLLFLAVINLDPMALGLAIGLVALLLGSGAVGGLVYHAVSPIRARGAIGYYAASIMTVYGYFGAVLGVLGLAALFVGWEVVGYDIRDMVTTRSGVLTWLVMGGIFGVVFGRALKD